MLQAPSRHNTPRRATRSVSSLSGRSNASRSWNKLKVIQRAVSRTSQPDKPPQGEGESKGAYCWRLIRHCVRFAVDLLKKVEMNKLVVSHGIHYGSRIAHSDYLQHISYKKKTREYLTTNGKELRLLQSDGHCTCTAPLLGEPLNRIIYAEQVNLYVGWIFQEDMLVVMAPDFSISSVSHAAGPILAATYNENNGDIVTIGAGYLTSWLFRYGARHLLPRKTSDQDLNPDDNYTLLILEETASHSQKAFAACGSNVAVFNLHQGKLLEIGRDLHVRPITALLFFNPLKYLITAARDGSIKVWDSKWHLQVVFVGHGGAVSSLAMYPYGPVIMSASHDRTIRVWSLETCDEVDRVDVDEPVLSLITAVNHENFASMSASHADVWKVENLHMLHTNIGHKVEHLKSTDHPELPVRALLMCRDASVRVLAPATGHVMTTLLGNPRTKLVDAAYAIEKNIIFAVYSNGDIIKCDASTNPSQVLATWKCSDPTKWCNYLLVYEYVIRADFIEDSWGGMKRAITTQHLSTTKGEKDANRTLLLGGRKDGNICVFNWMTGDIDFQIEAHGNKGVLSMIANSRNDQLISAGLDNIIKIWRLFPYAAESLAPLMSFYCAHTPIYMTMMRGKLTVAFQEHASATYSIVMYNLNRKDRHDHGPDEDHLDSITGLTSSHKLRIVASCSMDGTIRIWNEVNNLIRILKLNTTPHSISFCSQYGDLLVGIGDHVHRIDYKNYLPKAYLLKMMSMQFDDEIKEKPLPFEEVLLEDMTREDIKRLKAARSSFKFTHFMDILTKDETDEVMREKRQRESAFTALEQRENELKLIKDGGLKVRPRPPTKPSVKREAFEKYLDIFYHRNTVKPVDELGEEDLEVELKEEEPSKYHHPLTDTGFFPEALREQKAEQHLPVRSDGFVPNSVLIHLLWPNRKEDELKNLEENAKRWVPPTFSLEELDEISHRSPEHIEDDGVTIELSDRSLSVSPSTCRAKIIETEFLADEFGHQRSYLLHMARQTVKLHTEELESVETTPAPSYMQMNLVKAPKKPIQKLVAPWSETPAPIPSIREQSPPPRPVPEVVLPPPETPPPANQAVPLPDFMYRFLDDDWFKHFFPDLTSQVLTNPGTLAAFVHLMLQCLQTASWEHATQIVVQLRRLHLELGLPFPQEVQRTMFMLLHRKNLDDGRPLSSSSRQGSKLVAEVMHLLQELNEWDVDFFADILAQMVDGNSELREMCFDILSKCGVRDIYKFLEKEVDSWDVWNIDDAERQTVLRQMTTNWLKKWMALFKLHVKGTITKLKSGRNVHGHVRPGSHKRRLISGDKAHHSVTSHSQGVTVTLKKVPSEVADTSYTEIINYFIETQMAKRMKSMRKPSEVEPRNQCDTVLVLPKLPGKSSLARLGETHVSKCHPNRENTYATDLHLPPLVARTSSGYDDGLFAMPLTINLPLKTIYMNPFPSPIDAYDQSRAQQPLLLTLRTAQKYFVPARSLVAGR